MENVEPCNNDTQQHSKNRKQRGPAWSKAEHQSFLAGLKKLGRGEWKGIANNFVRTRTPTQVASHGQKYYLRLAGSDQKKRRRSVFDMPFKESAPPLPVSPISPLSNAAEIAPEGSTSTSPASPVKKAAAGIQGQASVQAQVANPLPSHRMEQHPSEASTSASPVLPPKRAAAEIQGQGSSVQAQVANPLPSHRMEQHPSKASTSASPVLPPKRAAAEIQGQGSSVQAQVANPLPSHRMEQHPSKASTSASPVLPPKRAAAEIQGQASSVQAQVANPPISRPMGPRPQVLPMAPTFAPHGIPYMVGVPGRNGQSFQHVWMAPMMHYPWPGYAYRPGSHGNLPTSAPITPHSFGFPAPQFPHPFGIPAPQFPHPFGIPAPQVVLPQGSSQAGPAISTLTPSSACKDDLELRIALPQNPQEVE